MGTRFDTLLGRFTMYRLTLALLAVLTLEAFPLSAAGLGGIAVAGLAASASKFLLGVRGRHIFDPAAIGAVVATLLGVSAAGWWVANPYLLPLVLLGALVQLTPTSTELVCEPARPVRFDAGQYMELTLPHDRADSRGARRTFSITSAPQDTFRISFGLRTAEPGSSFEPSSASGRDRASPPPWWAGFSACRMIPRFRCSLRRAASVSRPSSATCGTSRSPGRSATSSCSMS